MKKLLIAAIIVGACLGSAASQLINPIYTFTFMTANEKYFVSRLPQVGEAVEMVYVGNTDDGGMKFQLRTKEGN